ncbi:hypothetical protein [Psychroserpens ponticola]|uniref:Homing endonuclease LAGLIDADG domain-containing protein n=1 Tax=Psychroserpens ponticola TaxID=2932268 RepID=A0ABY7S2L7_9FLAO|nr:hypothetical protein [Psychroserpens ponticola]WCO03640.1 hypothetical protein MUN68_009035 [Psychroserpens ponticola]
MKIKSDADPEELTSPFYKANQDFCSEFESFISTKNGKVKGKYNAWSYIIYGKISNPKNWDLLYKKSTFSSTGNLFISSKKQCLLVLAEWSTKIPGNHNSKFKIRKRERLDFIKLLFNKNLSKLELSNDYIIYSNGHSIKLFAEINNVLKSLFLSKEIFAIEFNNDKLTVELRTEKHHFDIFNKLIEL